MNKLLLLVLLAIAFVCSGCYTTGTGYGYRRQPTTYNVNVRNYDQRLPAEIYDPYAFEKAFGEGFMRGFFGQ